MTYIKKIEIAVFGKFCGYEMEFDRGYNELIMQNEFGKSTITDFIIFMLYGLPKKQPKDKQLASHLLKKYMPWDGEGRISGALELVSDEKLYRIERFQRETGSGKVTVRDAVGAEIAVSGSPGFHFFRVDYETFLRTFTVRQADMSFFKTDGIETALKNLVTTGDESISFDRAIEQLRKKKVKYQYSGKTGGLIYSLPKEISLADEKIHLLKKEIAEVSDSAKALDETNALLTEMEQTEKELESQAEYAKACDAARNAQKLTALDKDMAQLCQRLESSGSDKTEYELYNARKAFDELAVLQKKSEQSAKSAQDAKAELDSQLESFPQYPLIQENEQEVKKLAGSKSKTNIFLLFAGILTIIFGALCLVGGVQSLEAFFAGIGLCALGIILFVLAFILRIRVKVPEKYGVDSKGICELYDRYCDVQSKLYIAQAIYEKAALEADADFEALANARAVCDSTGFKDKDEISKALTSKQSAQIIEDQLKRLETDRKALLEGMSEQELFALAAGGMTDGPTAMEVSQKIAIITNQKRGLITKSASLAECGRKKEELQRQVYEALRKKEELEAQLKEAIYQNDVLEYAISALSEAYDKINSIYSPILSEKAAKPLLAFTDGKYEKLYLDKSFEIRLQSEGETKELGYFSKGTQEAVYFALRNAVGEIISGEDGLPIVLDDPFWALDEKRLKKAREYLEKLSQFKQIIVFSAR